MKNEESCLWLNASRMPPPDKLKIKSKLKFVQRGFLCLQKSHCKDLVPKDWEDKHRSAYPEKDSAASLLRLLLSSAHPLGDPRCLLHSLMKDPIWLSPVRGLGNSVLATVGGSAPQRRSLPLSRFPRLVTFRCKKRSQGESLSLLREETTGTIPLTFDIQGSSSLTGSFTYWLSIIKKLFKSFVFSVEVVTFHKRRQI